MKKKQRKLSKKEAKAQKKQVEKSDLPSTTREEKRAVKAISLPETVTVGDFARISDRTPAEIIRVLIGNGMLISINDSIDYDTAEIIAPELDLEISHLEQVKPKRDVVEGDVESRPPVVVVMGHVDHGKTSLLDKIRESNVTANESGGITQHIGAYQVDWQVADDVRKITFIDTPGHEAFSAMRAHGANITDVVILVVSADEGVKPQTKEAVSHARAAGVPIIVALTKADLPSANPDKVKAELVELDLNPEDWGGKTPTLKVSSKTGEGIDDLLTTILLVADLSDIKARTSGPAEAVVIESHMAVGIGPVATVLIKDGVLKVGDSFYIDQVTGKVRFLEDDAGNRHRQAGPSMAVRVAGLSSVPSFGSTLIVAENDKEAKTLALKQSKAANHNTGGVIEFTDNIVPVILKADVDGSIKALEQALEGVVVQDSHVNVIHSGVGDISETDAHMASSTGAYLAAFRVGISSAARRIVKNEGLKYKKYDVIYDLVDDMVAAVQGALKTEMVEVEIGRLKVKGVFRTTKSTKIIGGKVESGKVVKDAIVIVKRDDVIIAKGDIESLQRGQTLTDQVNEGEECGISISINKPIEIDDVLIFSQEEEQIVKKSNEESQVE